MSGGHWDYRDSRSFYDMAEIFENQDFEELAGDKVTPLAKQINDWIHDVTHDVDWHLSGDTIIDDLPKWRKEKLNKLREILENV